MKKRNIYNQFIEDLKTLALEDLSLEDGVEILFQNTLGDQTKLLVLSQQKTIR
jgi:hypothetical protein